MVSQQTKQNGVALLAGVMFGLGLGLSQMIDRDRVLGFLDVTGQWDATLMFVLGGAVGVTLITFRFVLKQSHPLLSQQFYLPTKTSIDRPLIMGAALFGIGWGIGGYCPGPGVVSLVLGSWNPVLFLAAFIVGSWLTKTFLMAASPAARPTAAPVGHGESDEVGR
ncbi:MAG: YeeE/YedE family protein [Leptolyngbyaceae bacterium]|nr:YeeE/YedE family protein [Leptolyngbyaceae bacterium]